MYLSKPTEGTVPRGKHTNWPTWDNVSSTGTSVYSSGEGAEYVRVTRVSEAEDGGKYSISVFM